MFDKNITIVKRGSDGPSHHTHTHHEHRAPTDESIKLLKEMEDKVMEKFVGQFTTTNNLISARWGVFHDARNGGYHVNGKIVINGERKDMSFHIHQEWMMQPHHAVIDMLLTEVQKQIALVVTETLCPIVFQKR